MNERDQSVSPLRIGLVCYQSPKPRKEDLVRWHETPLSAPPSHIGYQYRYGSSVDVSDFDSLDFCTMDYNSSEVCLGLRLHGCGLPMTIGQWRSDKNMRQERLPTEMTLSNRRIGTRYCVMISNDEQNVAAITIEVLLEW
nr:hypothetical protein CFP56_20408 [Quercus suber]